MKQILFIILTMTIVSCNNHQDPQTAPQPTYIETVKIIKTKKEAINTRHKYKYNIWKDNFYHVPVVETVYYFGYTDGSVDQVDLKKYMFYEPGDTIREKRIQYH